jgi:hypothetical protein
VSLVELNTKTGVSGESFTKFLHAKAVKQRKEATDPMIIHQRRCVFAMEKIPEETRCTAGVYVCTDGHHLNGNALEMVKRAHQRKSKKKLEIEQRKNSERQDLQVKLHTVLTKGANPSK